MAGYIGRIAVPEFTADTVFPITPDYGSGMTIEPEVSVFRFLSGNAKIEQRFVLGNGYRKWSIVILTCNSRFSRVHSRQSSDSPDCQWVARSRRDAGGVSRSPPVRKSYVFRVVPHGTTRNAKVKHFREDRALTQPSRRTFRRRKKLTAILGVTVYSLAQPWRKAFPLFPLSNRFSA